jgi:hypothetical protein
MLFCLFSKGLKLKIYLKIPAVLYRIKKISPYGMGMVGKRKLRRIFESKREEITGRLRQHWSTQGIDSAFIICR